MSETRDDHECGGGRGKQPARGGERKRAASRMLAEWVSLAVSALLIVGIAGFLVFEIMQGNGPYSVAWTVARMADVQQVEGLFILPVEVENRGRRTLRDVEVELSYTPPGRQSPENATKKIDYLGEASKLTLYFYLSDDPRQMAVHVRPLHYRLD